MYLDFWYNVLSKKYTPYGSESSSVLSMTDIRNLWRVELGSGGH